MNYYLIKSINCIVSDERPNDNGDYWIYINSNTPFDGIITRSNNPDGWFEKLHDKDCYFKVLFSNNKIEGLKPFELVDEEEQEIRDALGMTYDAQINGQPRFKKMFQDDMIESLKTIREFNYKNGYPTKAKAGYAESQMIGFAEWIDKHEYFISRLDNKQWCYVNDDLEPVKVIAESTSELLTLYLQSQDSKLIEVIQISENPFKIK